MVDKICIAWDIHYKCNYKCPYCWFYGDLNLSSSSNSNISIKEWVRHWNIFYDKYGSSHIEITGGEPFIYPNFIDLVREISKWHSIRITTNLSVNMDSFLLKVNPENVIIISSFHPSFADLESFLRKALLLKERGYGDTVVYVAYPPQFVQIKYYRKIFEENGIMFAITPFCGIYNEALYPAAYNEEEKKTLGQYLRDESKIKYTLNHVSPRGKLCKAGYKFAMLLEGGEVARCGQLKNKIFANFFDKDFSLLSAPSPCESDFCPCDDHNYIVEE